MSLDPAATQKRLGDGFYEQRLVNEQVALLTGRRFLDGYSNEEAQYQALMNAGATYAQQYQLRPGISLSAAQMAALTSDIVWLVEQTITLPDGSTTKALVPQVYARAQAGDLDGAGTLLAGQVTNLNLTGDINNTGTVAGRSIVNLTAENVNNLGGRISGSDTSITARNDLNNIGGQIDGANSLTAIAGRDLNVTSTTSSASNYTEGTTVNNFSHTGMDRIAGLYVTNPNGTLVASAGRDVNVIAGMIQSQGSATIQAANNLNLGTVTTSSSASIVRGVGTDFLEDRQSTDVGSQVQANGQLSLRAGNDINAKAANVQAGGDLIALAGNNVNITNGRQTNSASFGMTSNDGDFFNSTSTTERRNGEQGNAVGSSLGGRTVTAVAGNDLNVTGSNVISDAGTRLVAGNNLTIEAATNTNSQSSFTEKKESGLLDGGMGITIGSREQSTDKKSQGSTAAASTVGSIAGNVTLQAGQAYKQVGSDVLAPAGDITILARKVDIVEARETSRTDTEEKSKQSGVTIALSNPVLNALQAGQQLVQAAGSTSDARSQALAGAAAALKGYNTYKDLTTNGEFDPAKAADIGITISLGSSESESKSTQTSNTGAGSTVGAGGNVSIRAIGGGAASNLTMQGSAVNADGNVTLEADNQVNLLASKNTATETSTNSSSSGSVGVSLGTNTGVSVSASKGSGSGNGSDTSYTNSTVTAGNTATIKSGGDTNLNGAIVSGNQVKADVGGNLNIASLQDTSTYTSQQSSSGGSLTFGTGGVTGGGLSSSKSNIDSNFASVAQQSGIKAGDGGFQVNVQGDTDLKGGVISSTQAAVDQGKNSFNTGGTLTLSDIQNSASYEGKASGISVDVGQQAGKFGVSGLGVGIGSEKGSASSTTTSGISGIAGNTGVRTGDAETGLKPIFDAAKVQASIDAQVQIMQAFTKEAPKAVGTFAQGKLNDAKVLKAQAAAEQNPERAAALSAQAQALEDTWGEGKPGRVLLHTLVGGLAGGLAGAAGAATSASAAPVMEELQASIERGLQSAGMSADAAKGIAQSVATLTAAGVGAAVGGAQGAVTAATVDANNRQLHTAEKQLISQLAKNKAAQICQGSTQCEAKSATYWSDMMEKAALSLVDDKAYAQNLQYLTELAQTANQKGTEGAMGAAQIYLDDYKTAQSMLSAKAGQVILINGQATISYGTAQTYFSATEQQRADSKDNVGFFNPQGSIVPNAELRDADRLETFKAQSGSAQPVYPAEEILLGGAIGNKLVSVAAKAIGELDLFFAGTTTASRGGTLNAGNVASEGLPVKLTVAEQTAIRTLDTQANVTAQGTLREIVADSYYQRNGFIALDGKCGGGNCFDGVYTKNGKLYVNEVKPLNADGTIKLSPENKATSLPAQMTDDWIESGIRRLKTGTPEQRELAVKLQEAFDDKTLIKIVTGVSSDGMTIIKLK